MPLLRLLIMFFLVFSFPGCKTTKTFHKVMISTHPLMEQQLTPSGDAVTFENEGIWGAVRPVSHGEMKDLSSLSGEWDFQNPFWELYDEYQMPIIFYLLIENRSSSAISFNPTASLSLFYGGEPLFPIEYEDLYQDLYNVRGGGAKLERIRRMLFRSYQTIMPNEHVRGLLLFRRPDAWRIKSKDILFRIRRLYVGGREIDFLIPFKMEVEKVKIPSP